MTQRDPGPRVGELEPKTVFLGVIWSKEGKLDYVRAERARDERLVAPNPWATAPTLSDSVHVVASPGRAGSRAALEHSLETLEVGGLTVHSFGSKINTLQLAKAHQKILQVHASTVF